jgi:hypothetical protein
MSHRSILKVNGPKHAPGASMWQRHRVGMACLASTTLGLLVPAIPAMASPASRVPVKPGQDVHVGGTGLWAVVESTNEGIAAFGYDVPSGSRYAAPYFFVATDRGVAVGRSGGKTEAARYLFTRSQPPLAGVSHPPAGHASGIVSLRLGGELRVAGTSLVLAAGRDPQGQAALAVVLMPGSSPVPASYEVGISAREVIVLRLHGNRFSPVFRVAEPREAPPPATGTTTTTSRPPTSTTVVSRGGTIGSSATLDGVKVKLLSVSDNVAPATVYDTLPAGQQFDTAKLEVTNVGSSEYVASSDGSTAIIGTDGKLYWPDTDFKAAGCTDFWANGASGQIDLKPGASASGCVHWRVPSGVGAKYLYYSPDAGWAHGDFITWYIG